MQLTEDQKLKKLAEHCGRNMLLPYKDEGTGFSCGFNLAKRKNEFTKIKRKKNKFHQSIKICRTQNLWYLCRCI